MMRAGVLTEHGAPPVVQRRPAPEPRPGHTTIQVVSAPITPLDVACASGESYFGPPELPYVPGVQGVGRVMESGVHDVGDLVWFRTWAGMTPGDGALRETALIPDEDVFAVPEGDHLKSLAALGLSAIAALMAMTWTGELVEGESVLILGGGGVVGQSAIQFARARGAARVVAVCRSDRSVEASRAHGAVPVQLRAGETPKELTARLLQASDGPVDLVLDTLWGEPATAALASMARHGRLVNLGSTAAERATFPSSVVRGGARQIRGYSNNDLTREQLMAALDEIGALLREGRLTSEAHEVPLEQIQAAWTTTATKSQAARQIVMFTAAT